MPMGIEYPSSPHGVIEVQAGAVDCSTLAGGCKLMLSEGQESQFAPNVDPFPTSVWGTTLATFSPLSLEVLVKSGTVYASLVFVYYRNRLILTNIAGRGWSIPGGRLELDETPEDAAVREVLEETGATVRSDALACIGCYLLEGQSGGAIRYVAVFVANAESVGTVPSGFESLGTRLVDFVEAREIYYLWDPLIEAVFDRAQEWARQSGWQ